jgi:hypothetical protein
MPNRIWASAPPTSRSARTTRLPCLANNMDRLAAITLFPTPPLPEPIDTIIAIETGLSPLCVFRRFFFRSTGRKTLAHMIHERFCCNRRSAAATSLRPSGSPLGPSTYCTSTRRGRRAPRAGLATRLSDFVTNRHESCGFALFFRMV